MQQVSEEDFNMLKELVLKLVKRVEKLESMLCPQESEKENCQQAETVSVNQEKLQQTVTALQEENKKLKEDNRELQKNEKELLQNYAALQEKNSALEQKQKSLQETVSTLQNNNAELQQKLAEKTDLPQQKELAAVYNHLQQTDETIKNLLTPYYMLDNFIVFLMQCGQFSLLNQFWASCKEYVLNEHSVPAGLKEWLLFLLSLYNQANAGNEAKELMAEPGSKYDYEKQQRVGENGANVQEMLLPGIVSPSGKINHKVLVKLQ